MSENKPAAAGADWTQLLSDPDLVHHLGELLKTYREAPPEKRDAALLQAMREIKQGAAPKTSPKTEEKPKAAAAVAAQPAPQPITAPPSTSPASSPPFEPDDFPPQWIQDRRRSPRMKCFVAVELRVAGSGAPIWGNLSNTSKGGCFVETSSPVPTGVTTEIGLWLANGKIWVKGVILTGVVTSSNPSFGVRVKFSEMEPAEREVLREFLRFIESQTKGYIQQNGYLAQMKR